MKLIKLQITEKTEHGLRANRCYFCTKGIKTVLKNSGRKGIQISKSPFKGSTELRVDGVKFSSKHGSYMACSDHPSAVEILLKGELYKPIGVLDWCAIKRFRFYAKAD